MFRGSITALLTPFENGKVAEKTFQELVNRQVEQGSQGVVPCGTTGESPTLNHPEHRRVTELCRGPVFWEAVAEDWSSSPNAARDAGVGIRGALAASDGRRNHPE